MILMALVCLPAANSFFLSRTSSVMRTRLHNLEVPPSHRTTRRLEAVNRGDDHEENENDDDDDDDDEEEEVTQTAYGNRSLVWTNRYRRLIPYEYARAQAMSMGLSSKEEWQTLGRTGPYLISRPDEMYQEEWISWEEFLGVMRPYEETKQLVQYVLKLKSMEEYRSFVQTDPKRAEGLRIPAKPEIVYKDSGWQGSEVFFGTNANSK